MSEDEDVQMSSGFEADDLFGEGDHQAQDLSSHLMLRLRMPPPLQHQEEKEDEPAAEQIAEQKSRDREAFEDARERRLQEARQDFADALERIRPKRKSTALSAESSLDLDDQIGAFKDRMMEACRADETASAASKPALAKLRLLPKVITLIGK